MFNLRRSQVFWIEAEPTFGGSGNQTEVPKKAGPFFGGSEDPSDGEEIYATFIFAGRRIKNKKINFRSPSQKESLNSMWRVNLPTAKQGGPGSYEGKIAVFQQRGSTTFTLNVLDKYDDQQAIAKLKAETTVETTQAGGDREFGYKVD